MGEHCDRREKADARVAAQRFSADHFEALADKLKARVEELVGAIEWATAECSPDEEGWCECMKALRRRACLDKPEPALGTLHCGTPGTSVHWLGGWPEPAAPLGDWSCKKCGARITVYACAASPKAGEICGGELVPCENPPKPLTIGGVKPPMPEPISAQPMTAPIRFDGPYNITGDGKERCLRMLVPKTPCDPFAPHYWQDHRPWYRRAWDALCRLARRALRLKEREIRT